MSANNSEVTINAPQVMDFFVKQKKRTTSFSSKYRNLWKDPYKWCPLSKWEPTIGTWAKKAQVEAQTMTCFQDMHTTHYEKWLYISHFREAHLLTCMGVWMLREVEYIAVASTSKIFQRWITHCDRKQTSDGHFDSRKAEQMNGDRNSLLSCWPAISDEEVK